LVHDVVDARVLEDGVGVVEMFGHKRTRLWVARDGVDDAERWPVGIGRRVRALYRCGPTPTAGAGTSTSTRARARARARGSLPMLIECALPSIDRSRTTSTCTKPTTQWYVCVECAAERAQLSLERATE
jgi:hypothetical protein